MATSKHVAGIMATSDTPLVKLARLNDHLVNISATAGAISTEIDATRIAIGELVTSFLVPVAGAPNNVLPFIAPPPTHGRVAMTRDDCEWIIKNEEATSTTGGFLVGKNLIGQIWHRVNGINNPDPEPVCIGVVDDGGMIQVCEGYSPQAISCISGQNIKLSIVGLTDDAKFAINMIGNKYGSVAEFGTYSIGIQAHNTDSFIMRQRGPVGDLIRMGCWWIPFTPATLHASGASLDHGFTSMVWAGEQYKGINLREHLFYYKSGGPLWIEENNLFGGNRSGFQRRPHIPYGSQPGTPAPTGPMVIRSNYCTDHGSNFQNADGGAVITVWSNPDYPTWIINNDIHNSRYGGIVLSDQSAERNWLNDQGFPISKVYVASNNVLGSARTDLSVSGVQELVTDNNLFNTVEINSKWSQQAAAAIAVGSVNGNLLMQTSESVMTWDASQNKMVPYYTGAV